MNTDKFLLAVLLFVFLVSFVSAETTFFEGDLGYGDDFIMVPIPEPEEPEEPEAARGVRRAPVAEVSIPEEQVEAAEELVVVEELEVFDRLLSCPSISDFLREQIREKGAVNYTQEELSFLTLKINEELGSDFSPSEVVYLVDNFEDECNRPLLFFSGLIPGRYRDLSFFLLIIVGLLVLIFTVYVAYRLLRWSRGREKILKKTRGVRKKEMVKTFLNIK